MFDIIKQTVEYQDWGFNGLSAGVVGVLVFWCFQTWGLYKQGNKIRDGVVKSGKESALSVHWIGYLAGFMLVNLPYGIHMKSALLVFSPAISFVFLARVLWNIYSLYGFTRDEVIGLVLYSLMIPLMILLPWMDIMYLVFSLGTAVALTTQPWKMFKEKSADGIEIRMLLTYLAMIVFWCIYAFAIESLALMILNPIVMIITVITILLWVKYTPGFE